jgi:hypothetical protein
MDDAKASAWRRNLMALISGCACPHRTTDWKMIDDMGMKGRARQRSCFAGTRTPSSPARTRAGRTSIAKEIAIVVRAGADLEVELCSDKL